MEQTLSVGWNIPKTKLKLKKNHFQPPKWRNSGQLALQHCRPWSMADGVWLTYCQFKKKQKSKRKIIETKAWVTADVNS